MTINDFIIKWNIRFATNDTFEIDEQDFREFKNDIAAFLSAAPGSSPALSELVLPQPVIADNLYLTGSAIWAARSSFNAVAPPMPGPNWRLVVSFAPTITAVSITDASPAGRSLLTAVSASVQLGLLDVLDIKAGQEGTHPAFTRAYQADGLLLFLLKGLMQVQQVQQTIKQVSPPAAPTAGQVDDNADTFSFLPNPAYPSFAQYKVNGLPGVTGAVVLDATNSYVSGSRIMVKVVGAVAKGGLAVYVAGSGGAPDGQVLTNAEAFTGTATPTPTPSSGFPYTFDFTFDN
jgi:hypothetical protein